MAWLCVDSNGAEVVFNNEISGKPVRLHFREFDQYYGMWSNYYDRVELPKGSIKRLIGRELTWDDEPIEFTKVEV
jgi:hypothetical protein